MIPFDPGTPTDAELPGPTAGQVFGHGVSQGLSDTSLGLLGRWADSGVPDSNVVDEQGFKASPYYRDGMTWTKGTTTGMLRAAAAKYDDEQSAFDRATHPVASGAGSLVGGMFDPLFYIPYVDVGAAGLRAGKGALALDALNSISKESALHSMLGVPEFTLEAVEKAATKNSVVREAEIQALNASGAAILEQPLVYKVDQAEGRDYDWTQAAESVGAAFLGGGFMGGLGAKLSGLTMDQRVAGLAKATEDLGMGRPVDVSDAVRPATDLNAQVRDALRTGNAVEPAEGMSETTVHAVQLAKRERAGEALGDDDKAFLESYKADGGESYVKNKIADILRDHPILREPGKYTPYENELTGLPNKRAYYRDQRMPVQVRFDMDNFKEINDRLGHEQGDEALRQIGQMHQAEAAREGGRVYHMSGDEFAGEFPDHASAQRAMAALRERGEGVRITHEADDGTTTQQKGLGLSYGIGKTAGEAESAQKADKAARAAAGFRHSRLESVPRGVGPDASAGRPYQYRDTADAADALGKFRLQLAEIQHPPVDWRSVYPTQPLPEEPDLSGLPLTDADKRYIEGGANIKSSAEGMAKAMKAGASCYGL